MITENNKILVAEVIPAVKLPREIAQFFSYGVPVDLQKDIRVGSVVEISFRKKNIFGVVYKLNSSMESEIKFKLKDINKVAVDLPRLSSKQIKLAEFVSSYYYSPLSLVIKTIIPAPAKNRARKDLGLNLDAGISEMKKEAVEKIWKSIGSKNLLIQNLNSSRFSLYLEIIKKQIKNGEQTLLLFPESFDIYNIANFYIQNFNRENISILTSEMTINQYFNEWNKVNSGSAKIIIGTRQAVFAPFKNLKLIIVDSEHSSSYKQWDMNPRYHGVRVAKKLAELWKAKIILSSPAPSIESYKDSIDKKLSTINFLRNSGKDRKFEIIDMNIERKRGNYSSLSENLKNNLLESIYDKKQAIIFIPRLGGNTVTKCKDCEFIAECPDCKNVLITLRSDLYCTRCKKKIEQITECPSCRGQNITSFGYGAEKVEKEIEKLFENKNIKIGRLDSSVTPAMQQKICKEFLYGKIDILAGTQTVFKSWNMKNLSVFAILFPEILFNQPDYRSREKAFQLLSSIPIGSVEEKKILFQTYNAENPLFEMINGIEIDSFYREELKARKISAKIGYPPFSNIIKLIYKNENRNIAKSEAQELYGILHNEIKNSDILKNNFELTMPFAASNFREYGKYRFYMVIRSASDDLRLRDSLLKIVKKDWIIDVDPDSLL